MAHKPWVDSREARSWGLNGKFDEIGADCS